MGRKPAQEDELLQQADESLNEDSNPIEIDGVIGDKQDGQSKESSPSINPDAISRLVAGATPTLMGFLMGSSPAMAANQIAQTKQTFEAGKPKKLVMVSGPDGQPIYEDSAMAVGEQPYVKPQRANTSGFKVEKIQDPVTGKETYARVDLLNKTMEPLTYIEGSQVARPNTFKGVSTTTYKDEFGNLKTLQADQYGNINGNKTLSQGKGQQYGIREEDVKIGDKMAQEALRRAQPIYESKANIEGAMSLLNTNPSQAIEQAAGVFKTAKIVVNERISKEEKDFVTQAPSVFQRYADELATNITGEQRQYIISQMRSILSKMDEVNNHALAAMQDSYVTTFAGNSSTKDEYNKKYDYLSKQIVRGPMMSVGEPTSPVKPFNPQSPSMNRGTKLTLDQFKALPTAQKERVLDEMRKKKGVK